MNSRAGYPTYALSRGASSPLEYYSKCNLLQNILNSLRYFKNGGEEGIRTLVVLPPNGFQDRLVMTASIPLRICRIATKLFYHKHRKKSTIYFKIKNSGEFSPLF